MVSLSNVFSLRVDEKFSRRKAFASLIHWYESDLICHDFPSTPKPEIGKILVPALPAISGEYWFWSYWSGLTGDA